MPVEYLSEDQARRYGCFQGDPNQEQLDRFFTFALEDASEIARQRVAANRLGYALQLGTVRFLGCFPDLDKVPAIVVHHVAHHLSISPALFEAYAASRVRFRHAAIIRARYGYTPFGAGLMHWKFLRWLAVRQVHLSSSSSSAGQEKLTRFMAHLTAANASCVFASGVATTTRGPIPTSFPSRA